MFKKEKTVDSILSAFTKTIDELKNHSDEQKKESVRLQSVIEETILKKEKAELELNKANNIVGKLEKLLSGE